MIFSRRRQAGRRSVRRDRAKCYKKIAQLNTKIKETERKAEKYRKRAQRLSTAGRAGPDTPRTKTRTLLRNFSASSELRRTLTFHHALVADLREKVLKSSRSTKRLMSRSIVGGIVKKYRFQRRLKQAVGFTQLNMRAQPLITRGPRTLAREVVKTASAFFERDDVSRMTTGKKETVTKLGDKRQKRLLCDTLQTLHLKFLADNTHMKISYASFCRLRPFWVRQPTEADRKTCQCKQHENLRFVAQSLQKVGACPTDDIEAMTDAIVCEPSSISCMYGRCAECKEKEFPFTSVLGREDPVSHFKWITKKNDEGYQVTVKETAESTFFDVVNLCQEMLKRFCKHIFNIRNQYHYYRMMRNTLETDECLIHVDFSENYVCRFANEIQSAHFGASHQQATLHTGCLYIAERVLPFCSISDSRQHDPSAIWEHLQPIFDWIETDHPAIAKVHFFSDGPTSQYRQKRNFFLFATRLEKYSLATWNFFEASHGKGAPDGIGGSLKRTADRLTRQGVDLSTPKQVYNALRDISTIKLFFVDEREVQRASVEMKAVEDTIQTVTGTLL